MFNPIERYLQIRRLGVLGMNRRNIRYIGRYNKRSVYPNVDNKLKTKLLATSYKVQTPELIGVLETQHDIQDLHSIVQGSEGFVIKPSKGSGGKGIILLRPTTDGQFEKLSGDAVTSNYIETHASNILSGLYSLGGKPDVAIIEALIIPDPVFDRYSYQGVPDIRVIVLQGFPVMAMVRLPTRQSDGKANLHQGAIGVGLDLGSGRATGAVQFDMPLTYHPDTGSLLSEIKVENWTTLLTLASRCHPMSALGYLGVDIVLDKKKGPVLLELNARPGLTIQIANSCGLLPRLRAVEKIKHAERMSAEEKVAFSQKNFARPEASSATPADTNTSV
ncbi:alpha-L-glutamate ligase-like protein [Pseudomaricurvus alcaniphilus]|uniref:alpha-L-glutamate ligase-like protein n=1 Tax=Pseudomaricurvus alcaniphilus TaxID=1166482 RepID=UPI0014087117|nr:alpha-L-glutamate ligase-like protein [Pseudomaricurvus alcaniphilus]NHN36988.1 alpha-L-glutamate ligase-like protein [Pseudomaricurvus alcaniphilus]